MDDDEIDKLLRELGLDMPDVEDAGEDDALLPRIEEDDPEDWL